MWCLTTQGNNSKKKRPPHHPPESTLTGFITLHCQTLPHPPSYTHTHTQCTQLLKPLVYDHFVSIPSGNNAPDHQRFRSIANVVHKNDKTHKKVTNANSHQRVYNGYRNFLPSSRGASGRLLEVGRKVHRATPVHLWLRLQHQGLLHVIPGETWASRSNPFCTWRSMGGGKGESRRERNQKRHRKRHLSIQLDICFFTPSQPSHTVGLFS